MKKVENRRLIKEKENKEQIAANSDSSGDTKRNNISKIKGQTRTQARLEY